jgi:hypothetical protein
MLAWNGTRKRGLGEVMGSLRLDVSHVALQIRLCSMKGGIIDALPRAPHMPWFYSGVTRRGLGPVLRMESGNVAPLLYNDPPNLRVDTSD